MNKPFANPVPTPYQQARFCYEAYKGKDASDGLFASYGYRLRHCKAQDTKGAVTIPMYMPACFPASISEAKVFDWSTLPGELSVGFALRGTDPSLIDNLAEDWQIFCGKVLEDDGPSEMGGKLATKVMSVLEGLFADYPQIEENGICLRVFLAGHSLGGLLAVGLTVLLQDWAATRCAQIHCTTFDSPGVVPHYRNLAMQENEDAAYWEATITNYLSLPNPINMCHPHLGKMVHLKVYHSVNITPSWAKKCFAATAVRLTGYAGAAQLSSSVGGSVGSGIAPAMGMAAPVLPAVQVAAANSAVSSAMEGSCTEAGVPKPHPQLSDLLDGVLLPAKVGNALASYFSLTCSELMDQHKLTNMLNCFDSHGDGVVEEGLAIEMESWPTYCSFKDTVWDIVKGIGVEFVPMHPGNIGIHNLMKRQEFVAYRLKHMRGYKARKSGASGKEKDISSGYCLVEEPQIGGSISHL